MKTWDELKTAVIANNNIHTVTMESLRDLNGSGKLGVHVIEEIQDALASRGLGHVPQELPSSQNDQVRLYVRGTEIGHLIETVLNVGEQNDKRLLEFAGKTKPDYGAVIEKIRALVAE
jgi:hypothetical protein